MTDKFLNKISNYAVNGTLFPSKGTVLAAVSGGCDSMCLLHSLLKLSDTFGFSVAAAHFNHMLRGDESDRDETFVAGHCKSLGIACYTGSGDVAAEAALRHSGTEEAARSMRYDFLEKVCSDNGFSAIATAHSADDNIETILLNFTRGAGLAGLSGIPPKRGNIIRPLLCVSRSEIEGFLDENRIPHVEDSSNFADDYTRNKIRHHVIPVLKEINPALCVSAFNAAELMAADNNCLTDMAKQFIGENFHKNQIPAKKLAELPHSVSSRVIRLLIPSLSKHHTDMVLDLCLSASPSAALDLPGMSVRRQYDSLVIGENSQKLTFSPFTLLPGDHADIPECGFRVTCEKTIYDSNIHNSFNNYYLKYDSIQGCVIIRPRISGDKIILSKHSGAKSLKKLFIDKHIPSINRELIPVIADKAGVIAVYGIGISARSKPTFGEIVLNIKFEEII